MRQHLRNAGLGRRGLAAERLERRDLLAGDVTITKSGSTLRITGDSASNGVMVTQGAEPGAYVVFGVSQGGADTTLKFNGDEGTEFEVEGIRDIVVNLNGGHDLFALSNVPADDEAPLRLRNVTINTQNGNDQVLLGGPVETFELEDYPLFLDPEALPLDDIAAASGPVTLYGNLLVNTGNDHDEVFARSVSSLGFQKYLLGTGHATAEIQGGEDGASIGSSLTISAANSKNHVADVNVIGVNIAKAVTLTTCAGHDFVEFIDSSADRLTIVTGAGNDEVWVGNTFLEEGQFTARVATINTGSWKDHINIGGVFGFDAVAAFVDLTVLAGINQDCVTIGFTIVTRSALLCGGLAQDVLTEDSNDYLGRKRVLLFEDPSLSDCPEHSED